MRTVLLTIIVSAFAGLPGAALAAPAQRDLPLTPEFAVAVSSYRDCVLERLDRASLAEPESMAKAAITACAAGHDAVRDRLATDIAAQHPGYSKARAQRFASDGMGMIDPMIAELALDRAREINEARAAIEGLSTAPQGNMG